MGEKEKRGCLGFLFGGNKEIKPEEAERLPYRVRDDFLSAAEFSFYKVLGQIFEERYVICPKVSLKDLFFVSGSDEKIAYNNRIDRKHVDFVLCDRTTMMPVLGVELDDRSHTRKDREERDLFVGRVFEAANLPLARVTAAASYNLEELKSYLKEQMAQAKGQDPVAVTEDPVSAVEEAAAAESGVPVCLKCQIPMVIRVSKRGGIKFYGCSNYPQCTLTRSLED